MKIDSMKELYKLKLNTSITKIESDDSSVSLYFGDRVMGLRTTHDQDCCESVYGDFGNFKYQKDDILKSKSTEIIINGVESLGFLVSFGGYPLIKVLVPCYNSQNGYYSDELLLSIKDGEKEVILDLKDYKDNDGN